MSKITKFFQKLIHSNNTPHEIALGVAIGVIIAITPLYGLHTIMVVLCAMMIPRTNKIALLLGTNISIPITLPFITWAGYEIGRLVLRNKYPAIELAILKTLTYRDIAHLYWPLFVGSIILGLVCAVIVYFIVLFFAAKIRKKREVI